MKILITGSTGYVGRHLVPMLLSKGHILLELVRSFSDANFADQTQSTRYVVGANQKELKEVIAKFRPEVCIHLASHLSSLDDYDHLQMILSANIIYTCRVLDAIKDLSLKLFINTGTFAEYYRGDGHLDPAYLYAASKTAARSFVKYYASVAKFKAINVVPYTIYGGETKQEKIIDLIHRSIGSISALDLTPGHQVLDFIHINDVIDFYSLLIEQQEAIPEDSTFSLGSGRGHTLRELAKIIERESGNSKANINWGGRNYRSKDPFYSVADISLQYRLWKWRPKINMVDGVRAYLKSTINVT